MLFMAKSPRLNAVWTRLVLGRGFVASLMIENESFCCITRHEITLFSMFQPNIKLIEEKEKGMLIIHILTVVDLSTEV